MFTVFDLETTGLSSMTHDVIQFAYITYDENNMPLRAESLYFYYEGMSWTEEAYAVHQIPISFLKQHADKFEENLIKMYAVLMNANVCGHNAKAFDCVFAKNWLSRMGLHNLQYRCIQDTMTAFKSIVRRPRIKLIKLAEILGVTDEVVNRILPSVFKDDMATQAHNAAFDTMRTGIITLIGLNKNLIDFSGESVTAAPYIEDDIYNDGEEAVGRDPIGLLVRFEDESGELSYAYVSPNVGYHDEIPTQSEIRDFKGTTKCIRGTFKFVENSVWELIYNKSKLILKDLHNGTWSLEIQLMETMPVQEFFNYENRDVFVNAFNKDIPEWEV